MRPICPEMATPSSVGRTRRNAVSPGSARVADKCERRKGCNVNAAAPLMNSLLCIPYDFTLTTAHRYATKWLGLRQTDLACLRQQTCVPHLRENSMGR